MCGRSPEYNAYFAAGSAIFVSFLNIILESIKRSEQWFLVVHIVIWSGLILVAIVLIFGIYYENKFLVMVWIVLMLVFGVALLALRILDLTKLSENNEIIRTSIRILFHCALFSVWLWISIVYYLTL
ncbi:uncharacterized protein LOC113567272 [Drosophila persimilis]|uniref:uncharacterized protein LOC113567272 n=1 Tax=Drosophila persimilis TaxID=7234 RepID=UPI000F095BF6|nr:uncharacterized protein LOC113567272 [Drosophila persimilis]